MHFVSQRLGFDTGEGHGERWCHPAGLKTQMFPDVVAHFFHEQDSRSSGHIFLNVQCVIIFWDLTVVLTGRPNNDNWTVSFSSHMSIVTIIFR